MERRADRKFFNQTVSKISSGFGIAKSDRAEIFGKAEEEWPEKWRTRDNGRAEKKLKEKQEMTRAASLSSDIRRSFHKGRKTRLKTQKSDESLRDIGRRESRRVFRSNESKLYLQNFPLAGSWATKDQIRVISEVSVNIPKL